jgi:hypothetical protein
MEPRKPTRVRCFNIEGYGLRHIKFLSFSWPRPNGNADLALVVPCLIMSHKVKTMKTVKDILKLTMTYAGIHILLMETLLIVSGSGKRVYIQSFNIISYLGKMIGRIYDSYRIGSPRYALFCCNFGLRIVDATNFGEERSVFSFNQPTRCRAYGADNVSSRVRTSL